MPTYTAPIPTLDLARDLTDAEFAELDDLLVETPEPLQPCDAVMLDGFLCGVLVQPVLLTAEQWLPFVFDFEGQPLPADVDADWRDRTVALVMRRHAALNRALVEDGWFDPLVLEFDDEPSEDDPGEPPASEAAGAEATDAAGDPDPMDGMGPISQALMPWVAGFQHATISFPELSELSDEAVVTALARLFRHLPAETDEEKEIVTLLDAENPLATLEDAIEDMVVVVADLFDLTQDARYHVETVKRDTPKLGRNDPCFCGSGKKFKNCHGG